MFAQLYYSRCKLIISIRRWEESATRKGYTQQSNAWHACKTSLIVAYFCYCCTFFHDLIFVVNTFLCWLLLRLLCRLWDRLSLFLSWHFSAIYKTFELNIFRLVLSHEMKYNTFCTYVIKLYDSLAYDKCSIIHYVLCNVTATRTQP